MVLCGLGFSGPGVSSFNPRQQVTLSKPETAVLAHGVKVSTVNGAIKCGARYVIEARSLGDCEVSGATALHEFGYSLFGEEYARTFAHTRQFSRALTRP
jgi:hypothetical protein